MKEYLMSLGVKGVMNLYKERGHENLGQLIEEITGAPCSSYGVLTGGILLSEETWWLLKGIPYEEWEKMVASTPVQR